MSIASFLKFIIVCTFCISAFSLGVVGFSKIWLHKLQVSFLDIGQGDSIYIQAKSGNQMFIDGGPANALSEKLPSVLPWGDKEIAVLIVTNPDADHFSGFIELIKNYKVGVVIESGTISQTPTYEKLENLIEEKHIPHIFARKGMRIILDEKDRAEMDILFPNQDVSNWTSNDGSIVGKFVSPKTSVMFMGDATQKTEQIILSENSAENLKSDVLKVGHHGSRTSTSEDFLKSVAPKYAVISSGKGNKYGHPHKETLDILKKYEVRILRTDSGDKVVP